MAQATAYNMTQARGARKTYLTNSNELSHKIHHYILYYHKAVLLMQCLRSGILMILEHLILNPYLTVLIFSSLEEATTSTGSPGTAGDTGDFEFKFANKVRAGNRIQQLRSGFTVSPMTEKIAIAGLASPYAEAKAKATLELKRSIEVMIASNEKGAVQNAGLGDISAGLGQWSNPGNGAGTMWHSSGINTASANYRPVSGSRLVFGSGKTLTENDGSGNNLSFRSMLQKY